MSYRYNNQAAPYHRRRNLSNAEMNAVLMDFATCTQLIANTPTRNGFIDRTATHQQIHAHLATIIRLGTAPLTPDGRFEIFMILNTIRHIRAEIAGYQG